MKHPISPKENEEIKKQAGSMYGASCTKKYRLFLREKTILPVDGGLCERIKKAIRLIIKKEIILYFK